MPAFTRNEHESGSPTIWDRENANFESQKHFDKKLEPDFHI